MKNKFTKYAKIISIVSCGLNSPHSGHSYYSDSMYKDQDKFIKYGKIAGNVGCCFSRTHGGQNYDSDSMYKEQDKFTKYAKIISKAGCIFSTTGANYDSDSMYREQEQDKFTKYAKIIGPSGCTFSAPHDWRQYKLDGMYREKEQDKFTKYRKRQYMSGYFSACYHVNNNSISDVPLHAVKSGCTNNKLSDKLADQLYGTEEELTNWKYFTFHNDLPLFLNIVLNYDANNASKYVMPWMVDKKYTDEEIYDKLGFTYEEKELIERTLDKYERYSTWFKRYSNGRDKD